jgi:RNA polymerase sigma-70 factor (ECF subfamily)
MERYSNGDTAAFGELYDALVPRLYAFVLRKVRDPARAEDLVQQSMLQVHCARGRFVPGSRVTPWVYAIATRLFLDQARRKKIEVLASDGDEERERASDRPGPDSFTESRELEAILRAEVERLSTAQRQAFELVVYAQMSHAEAAETLGVTVASIKLRLQRANHAVRDALRLAEHAGIDS